MSDHEKTLTDRGQIYGSYAEGTKFRAKVMRLIKDRYLSQNDESMPEFEEMMIWDLVNKLSRLAVAPTHQDTIHDIVCYAKLYEEIINAKSSKQSS